MSTHCLKPVAWCLVLVMTLLGFVPRVEAGIAPSGQLASHDSDLAAVERLLENKKVATHLEALGFSSQETSAKLGQLSDADLHQLAQNLDSVNVGGVDALGFVVGVGIIVLIIVAYLYFTGQRVAVKGTR